MPGAEEEPPSSGGGQAPRAVIALALEAPESWPLAEESLRAVIERAAGAALAVAAADGATVEKDGVPPLIDVSLVDDETMRAVNAEWRGRDAPTNVLSFPAAAMPFVPDAPWPLGALMLAGGVLQREAAARGVALADHLAWMVVHGILHLLGYDHERNAAEAEHMEALERAALNRLGLPDPYAEGQPSAE
jgi:probable rRNA maturation factor